MSLTGGESRNWAWDFVRTMVVSVGGSVARVGVASARLVFIPSNSIINSIQKNLIEKKFIENFLIEYFLIEILNSKKKS